jgi:hypothetical protein
MFDESIHSSTAINELQECSKSPTRENRQNGNQEGSEEGTCKEGSRQEGAREEGRKEEVAVNQQQGNIRGDAQSVPSVFMRME